MDNKVLEASKNLELSPRTSVLGGFIQVIFGVIPAAIGVLELLGVASSGHGNHVWAHRVHFLLACAGLVGLVWGMVPAPRWAAWATLSLLLCGYVAVGIFLWPSPRNLATSSAAILVVISPFVAGPIAVGCYQAVKAIQRLRNPKRALRNVA